MFRHRVYSYTVCAYVSHCIAYTTSSRPTAQYYSWISYTKRAYNFENFFDYFHTTYTSSWLLIKYSIHKIPIPFIHNFHETEKVASQRFYRNITRKNGLCEVTQQIASVFKATVLEMNTHSILKVTLSHGWV